MVYMLIGYDWHDGLIDDYLYRFEKLNAFGVLPYPMVYNNENRKLKLFQQWVVRRYYQFISWEDFQNTTAGQYYKAKIGNLSGNLFEESAIQ